MKYSLQLTSTSSRNSSTIPSTPAKSKQKQKPSKFWDHDTNNIKAMDSHLSNSKKKVKIGYLQINLLTCVLDNTPILPEEIGKDSLKILKNGPQCVAFGVFIIWFSSITLNLGPTFLSGAISSGITIIVIILFFIFIKIQAFQVINIIVI